MEEIIKVLMKRGIWKRVLKDGGKKVIKDSIINAGYNACYTKKAEIINKASTEIANNIEGIKDIPNEMMMEMKRQSSHENTRQPFSEYDYFGSYYKAEGNRYNPTPTVNLAEYQARKEEINRRLRGF